jgi:hypothetical protein
MTLAKTITRRLKSFARDLREGRPIKVTRVERHETPDGPMHVTATRYVRAVK